MIAGKGELVVDQRFFTTRGTIDHISFLCPIVANVVKKEYYENKA